MKTFFISGIGTDVGKTIASAILIEALQANYWKPVQAGFAEGTDKELVQSLITNNRSIFFDETYRLQLPASPHIAAREDGIQIDSDKILVQFEKIKKNAAPDDILIIEGAGGLMVPLNENEFVIDLIKKLDAKTILVSRNYLGSINHSLLSTAVCKEKGISLAGWIFNDTYMQYEDEIVAWSGIPKIASLPFCAAITKEFIFEAAAKLKERIVSVLAE